MTLPKDRERRSRLIRTEAANALHVASLEIFTPIKKQPHEGTSGIHTTVEDLHEKRPGPMPSRMRAYIIQGTVQLNARGEKEEENNKISDNSWKQNHPISYRMHQARAC